MDLSSSFVRGDTTSVQSTTENGNKLAKTRLIFFSPIIVVYVIIKSLVQISLRSPDKVMWLILLSSSIGYHRQVWNSRNNLFHLPIPIQKKSNHERFLLDIAGWHFTKHIANNKQSSFTVRLDHPIQIDKDNWEVVWSISLLHQKWKILLMKIISSTWDFSINKLDATDLKVICNETSTCVDMKLKVPTGYYSSPQHVFEAKHNAINARYSITLRNSTASITIDYGTNNARVKADFQDSNRVKLIFPTPMAEKLGVNQKYFSNPIGNERRAFIHSIDLNTKIHQLYVFSDIASYTFFADVTSPILRVVSFETLKERHHLHQEFVNVHYVPVAKSFIYQGHISIKGDMGDNVPFITGKTLKKLHFKQKE